MNNYELYRCVDKIIEIENKAMKKKIEMDETSNKKSIDKIDSDVVDDIVDLIENGVDEDED